MRQSYLKFIIWIYLFIIVTFQLRTYMGILFQVYFKEGYYHLLKKGYMHWFCSLLALNLISLNLVFFISL